VQILKKQLLLGLDRGVWGYNLRNICEKCLELKLDGLEIQLEHPEIFKNFPESNELKSILNEFEFKLLSIHAPIKDINLSSYNPRIRRTSLEELKDTIKFAATLSDNILYIVVHGGQNSFRSPSRFERKFLSKAMQFTIDGLKELSKECDQFGITLSVENMTFSPWRLSSKIRHLDQIFGAIPNLKFTFDYAHGLIGSQRYSYRLLKHYMNRLISVHIGNFYEIRNIYNFIKNHNPYIIIEPHHLSSENNIFNQLGIIIPKILSLK
jgi:sugar phosphate isomerase/epimerase